MEARRLAVRAALGCLLLASVSARARAQQSPWRPAPARVTPGQWSAVARALGVAGEIRGDVFRVNFAPFAATVRMRGVRLASGAIPGSWVCFGQQGALGWMMGRLLMPARRGSRTAAVLARHGLEVTGVVDPLPGSSPAVVAVYFRGMGDAAKLAGALKRSLGRALRPPSAARAGRLGRLNARRIDRVLGRRGEPVSGALVFRVSLPEQVKCCGLENDPLLVFSGVPLGPATGMESRIAFQPQGARAVVSGRLAVRHGEVGPVERALSVFGIGMVALVDPLPDERPRIFFLHFFGRGKPLDLAQGLRAAIERMHPLPPVTKP